MLQQAVRTSPGEIPFCRTEITAGAQRAAQRVLAGGWVTTGPEVTAFERDLAEWIGAEHVVAVSSCTAAIEMALTALDLPPGSPVLTPTLTFCGAVQAIVHSRLRPVLVDADEETLTVSPAGVAKAAARHGAAAIVVQHMAGYPVDGPALAEAAAVAPYRVIDDAAHGLGGTLAGRPVGCDAAAACFSFYATKNLPIGEGGAVATTDPALAGRLRRMSLHGMSGDAWARYQRPGGWRYEVDDIGFKANMTDLQAAIGRAQLQWLHRWQSRRAAIASMYDSLLCGIPGLILPPRPAGGGHAWHLYVVRVGPGFGLDRDEVVDELKRLGIGTSVHFVPVHHHAYFRRLLGAGACDGLRTADRLAGQLLSLPLHPALATSDVARVCEALSGLSDRTS